jgi:hypothetical protein
MSSAGWIMILMTCLIVGCAFFGFVFWLKDGKTGSTRNDSQTIPAPRRYVLEDNVSLTHIQRIVFLKYLSDYLSKLNDSALSFAAATDEHYGFVVKAYRGVPGADERRVLQHLRDGFHGSEFLYMEANILYQDTKPIQLGANLYVNNESVVTVELTAAAFAEYLDKAEFASIPKNEGLDQVWPPTPDK